ncbi:MAG TPA: hypothetical protein VM118_03585 [Acidobacteriota bacterium]|nr:hypothetical protein [Acidobacteriota bacterium]
MRMCGYNDCWRKALWPVLIGSVLVSGPVVVAHAADAIPQRFIRDTIYHAVVDLKDATIGIAYGPYPLVDCSWQAADSAGVTRFATAWQDEDKEWRLVTARRLWSGMPAVPRREVGVVAEITHADPSLIQRMLPDRFTIALSDGFCLQVVTPRGSVRKPTFRERLSGWLSSLNPLTAAGTSLRVIVSPEDAQTLYYALEPGTPVMIRSDR